MSDEQERQEPGSPPPPEAEGDFTWGHNQRGDLVIDNVVVERNVHVPDGGLPSAASPPSPEPDEMAAIRRENAELRQQFEAGEPWLRLADKPVLKQILDEYISRGEVEAPRGPVPSIEDSAGFQLRASEPEFEAVREVLRQHAATLRTMKRRHWTITRRCLTPTTTG